MRGDFSFHVQSRNIHHNHHQQALCEYKMIPVMIQFHILVLTCVTKRMLPFRGGKNGNLFCVFLHFSVALKDRNIKGVNGASDSLTGSVLLLPFNPQAPVSSPSAGEVKWGLWIACVSQALSNVLEQAAPSVQQHKVERRGARMIPCVAFFWRESGENISSLSLPL